MLLWPSARLLTGGHTPSSLASQLPTQHSSNLLTIAFRNALISRSKRRLSYIYDSAGLQHALSCFLIVLSKLVQVGKMSSSISTQLDMLYTMMYFASAKTDYEHKSADSQLLTLA